MSLNEIAYSWRILIKKNLSHSIIIFVFKKSISLLSSILQFWNLKPSESNALWIKNETLKKHKINVSVKSTLNP